jgi:hypothetical protein
MDINSLMKLDYNINDIWIPSKIRNGRVDILDKIKGSTKIVKESILSENNANSISQSLTNTSLSLKFFSKENINIIQTLIRKGVYQKSNNTHIISNQNEQELMIIMRSIYLQYGKNLPNNIDGQINELNNKIVEWAVENIISNIQQYISYKKFSSTLPMPLERAQLPSQKGTKTLELTRTYI